MRQVAEDQVGQCAQADDERVAASRRCGRRLIVLTGQPRRSQALQAHPSGNNVASRLARWDAGLQAAFVAKMNAAAGPPGLRNMRSADVGGADPAMAGTAAGPFPAALSVLAGSQMHLCPRGHGYVFTAHAMG